MDARSETPHDERRFGLTGLATMGQNLARNVARHGFPIAVHNRTAARADQLLARHGDEGDLVAHHDLPAFVGALARPRLVMVMVQAGPPVDEVLGQLRPLLDQGDVVIDGGNSAYADTIRRGAELAVDGVEYVGAGVSGGEEGALHGPSIMVGGSDRAWAEVAPVLTAIAAQVDGEPCCAHIGPDGAGHHVKMVHNGIEYADMQLIAETYELLRSGLGLANVAMADVFEEWNRGDLDSFLIGITARVLRQRDDQGDGFLVDHILDAAGQKGTGRWRAPPGPGRAAAGTGMASRHAQPRDDRRAGGLASPAGGLPARRARPPGRHRRLHGRPARRRDHRAGGDARGTAGRLDHVHRPDGRRRPGAGPVVVYLHGGADEIGSIHAYRRFASELAVLLDAAVVIVEYRLAPEHPFPAAVDDALAAYRELLDGGHEPATIALIGDSAGGGLVVATMLAVGRARLLQPAAGVCLSPWADLTLTADSYERCARTDPFLDRVQMAQSAANYLAGADPHDPLASPARAPLAELGALAPLLIQASAAEAIADDASLLGDRIREAGGEVRCELWPDLTHVWHTMDPEIPEVREARATIARFIGERWKRPASA